MLVKHQTPSSLPWNCLVKCYRSQHLTQWISKLLIELQVAGTNCLNIGKWLQLSPNPVWRFLCSLLHFSENLYIPRFMLIMFSLEFICVFIYFFDFFFAFLSTSKEKPEYELCCKQTESSPESETMFYISVVDTSWSNPRFINTDAICSGLFGQITSIISFFHSCRFM